LSSFETELTESNFSELKLAQQKAIWNSRVDRLAGSWYFDQWMENKKASWLCGTLFYF